FVPGEKRPARKQCQREGGQRYHGSGIHVQRRKREQTDQDQDVRDQERTARRVRDTPAGGAPCQSWRQWLHKLPRCSLLRSGLRRKASCQVSRLNTAATASKSSSMRSHHRQAVNDWITSLSNRLRIVRAGTPAAIE